MHRWITRPDSIGIVENCILSKYQSGMDLDYDIVEELDPNVVYRDDLAAMVIER
jgi:hypothetical protein